MLQARTTEYPNNTATEPFVCHYCDASFKIMGYLNRHIKKHAIEKPFRCPFYDPTQDAKYRCHSYGGFSRRDTFKMHLKARHFKYAHRDKKGKDGNIVNNIEGTCLQCGQYFSSCYDWVKDHIEGGQCKKIPSDYKLGKTNNHGKNKLKRFKTSNGSIRYISTEKSIVEPAVLKNKEALEVMKLLAKEKGGKVLEKYDDKFVMGKRLADEQLEEEENIEDELLNWRGSSYINNKRKNQDDIQEELPEGLIDHHLFKENTHISDIRNKKVKHNDASSLIFDSTKELQLEKNKEDRDIIPFDLSIYCEDDVPECIRNNLNFYDYNKVNSIQNKKEVEITMNNDQNESSFINNTNSINLLDFDIELSDISKKYLEYYGNLIGLQVQDSNNNINNHL